MTSILRIMLTQTTTKRYWRGGRKNMVYQPYLPVHHQTALSPRTLQLLTFLLFNRALGQFIPSTTWLFRKVREFPGWFWPEWERRKWQWFKWISEAKVTQMCSNKKYPDPYGRREREVCENRLSQTNLSNLSVNHQQSFYLNLSVKKNKKKYTNYL